MPKQPSGESCISMRQSDAVWFHPAEVDSWTAGSISHSSKTAIIGVRPSTTTPGFAIHVQFTTVYLCLLSFTCDLDAYSRRIWPIPSWTGLPSPSTMDFARRIHDRGNAKGIARRREFLNPDTTHMTWHQQSGTAARNVLRGEWAACVIAAPKGTQGLLARGENPSRFRVRLQPAASWLGTFVN